jgi:hypothetical protein
MIKVPVAVDNRHDRLPARLCGGEDLLLLGWVAACVDDDQAPRRVEDDAVAVWLRTFLECPE